MKRGITAVIIVLFCISLAVTTNIVLNKNAEKIETLAQSAMLDKVNFPALEKEWNKSTVIFSLFSDHNKFEEINIQIEKAKHFDGEEYQNACIEIITYSTQLKKSLSYSFYNIL